MEGKYMITGACFLESTEYNKKYNILEGIDMSIKLNLQGQLKSIDLPKYKSLWPLFECIVNSIQSIEDSVGYEDGQIIITANRAYEDQPLYESNHNSPFESFTIRDNGSGFNKKNYDSFQEAYSTLKVSKGCKGVGRFLWLKSFQVVHIDSVFLEDGQCYKRSFDFDAEREIYPEDNLQMLEGKHPNSTMVHLDRIVKIYQDENPKSLKVLAKKIIEHCLLYFISKTCPRIILRDDAGEEIVINEWYDNVVEESLHKDIITIKGREFTLYNLRVYSGQKNHEIHFCANNREVLSEELNKYIGNLQKRIIDSETKKGYYYQGFLIGEYLDQKVNPSRTDFYFDAKKSGLYYDQVITQDDIIDVCSEYIKLYLHQDLQIVQQEKEAHTIRFVSNKKPHYRFLLAHRPQFLEKVPAGLDDVALELELHKEEQRWENELLKQTLDIDQMVKQDSVLPDDFQAIFEEYCQQLSGINQASLSEYVTRRKSVLTLLERGMNRKEDGKFNKEKYLHELIYPMRESSDGIAYEQHNLWLIDERLSYCSYISSDIPFDDQKKRPDILILDHPVALSETKENGIFNTIILFELKRPMRDDYSEKENPIDQLYGYIKKIKSGKAVDKDGRTIKIVETTKFYAYAICDITSSLEDILVSRDFKKMPDSLGQYLYHAGYNAYIEVIPFDKLLGDAIKRNQILFDKLFSPEIDKTLRGCLVGKTVDNSL